MGVVLLILKILLYIILAVLGIILIVLAVPVGAEISFIDEKLSYKIKVSFLNRFKWRRSDCVAQKAP